MDFRIVVISLGFGVLLTYMGFSALKKRRLIENTPTSKIRSIAMGPVELIGTATTKKQIISPISNISCAYMQIDIQEYKSRGKSSRYVTVWSDIPNRYFTLNDGTGKVKIDTFLAEIKVKNKKYENTNHKKIHPKFYSFIESKGIKTSNIIGFKKTFRIYELMLPQNQEVYVFGNADNNPLIKDGTTIKNEEDIMIMKKNGMPFIISDKKEEKLINSYKLWILLGLPAGILLLALGIWSLINMF